MLSAWFVAAAWASEPTTGLVGCSAPVATASLHHELEQAERAYGEATEAALTGFKRRVTAIRGELHCLGEQLPVATVAQVDRVLGLEAWINRSVPGTLPTRVYFAAARNLMPDYVFPTSIVGAEDPEAREYAGVLVDFSAARTEPERTGLSVVVDGVRGRQRHPDWPSILQWTAADGEAVRCTEYLLPAEPSRCAVALGAPITAVRTKKTRGVVALSGGAVLVGGGAALQIWNAGRRSELELDAECSDVRESGDDADHNCTYSADHLAELDALSATDTAVAIGLLAVGGVALVYGGVTFFVSAERVVVGTALVF